MLLHWPRCNDVIPWMNCEAEEEILPQSVRAVSVAPHLDKENSWKGSWKALEDLYTEHSSLRNDKRTTNQAIIASIGYPILN